jgi:hypothetical protein
VQAEATHRYVIFRESGKRPRAVSTFRRSPDLRLGQIELRLQLRPLRFGLRSRRKGFACAPQRMAIQDVPFKWAIRARMPPHVEKPLFHRP